MFPNQVAEVELPSMGRNSKIASHSPFDEHILRRYFLPLDCAASKQSRANQFGRLRGVVQTTFSHRIASHSPCDWTGNRTGLPLGRNIIQSLISG